MKEEPSSVSTETLDGSLAPSSLAINSYADINTQYVMASKGTQRKLLSPSRAISGSENCNPNVTHGSCKRKINNRPKSSAAEQFLESNNAPKHLTGQACAEFNLISPPRKHVCSSRRCASKNPDYAVPATVNSKKFLVSKRHVLPPKEATLCKCCLQKRKGEDVAADEQNSSVEFCSSCSRESQKRRWSSDDSASRYLTGNGEAVAFSLTSSERYGKNGLDNSDAGPTEKASMSEAIRLPAPGIAHQERSNDTPKSWNRPNDSPNLHPHCGDNPDRQLETVSDEHYLADSITSPTASALSSGCCGSESKHRAAYFNEHELQASPLLAGEGPYHFGLSCLNPTPENLTSAAAEDDGNSSLMPENEEAVLSPSPEKSGNWRLNAVLEAFGNLSPTREGRVKTLVRAFESLLSVTDRKGEQQARKPRGYSLKFSYLSSNANLEGEEAPQRENFTDGGEEEVEKEEATDGEERVQQWQTNLTEGDTRDEETGDRWQSPHKERVYSQSTVEDKEKDGMGEQWQQEQECAESREEVESDERENGMEKVLQKQEAQHDNKRPCVDEEDKDGLREQCQLPVVGDDEKQWQEHEAEQEYAHSLQEGLTGEEVGEMKKVSQKQGILAHSVVEENGDEDDKENEEQAEGIYAQTLEKADETDKRKQQNSDIESTHSLKNVFIESEAKKDSASQELETRHVPVLSVNLMAAFESQLPNQKIRTNLQQRPSHKSIDGHFASTVAWKNQSSRLREPLRGSNCSISSTRPVLAQKSQMQSVDKPRFSKPQPFKLLTEERGHMKEQEFVMRLRKILEEEEKLRVPLAQGLPWTTDEPEIPYKPPVKENTKPLDIHLNSDLRAMERAEFDRFIEEKLLYIEERRLEEECLRRAAEEEEIKKMRQEMVPKAQLMPYFDRPFRPRRSSKRPTIPKEPQFQLNKQHKRQKCAANST